MFNWLPCFAPSIVRVETLVVIIFFFRMKNNGHALPCRSSSSHALNYSLSLMCGTASIGVHQPCTKLLRSRVTVDYPDRSATVMPNELSNHKPPSFRAVSWTDEATIISLFSLSFLSTQPSLLPHLVPHFFKKTTTCFYHCSSLPKKER